MAATQPRTSKPAGSSGPPAKDMVWVPGGDFLMGSEDFYPEERPIHRVKVDGFWDGDVGPRAIAVQSWQLTSNNGAGGSMDLRDLVAQARSDFA